MEIKEIVELIIENNKNIFEDFNHRKYSCYAYAWEENANALMIKYSPGGISGGSCWDSSNPEPYKNDVEQMHRAGLSGNIKNYIDRIFDFDYPYYNYLIDSALDSNQPIGSYTQYEYYGNCEHFAVVAINIKEIAECFKDEADKELFLTTFNQEAEIFKQDYQNTVARNKP